MGLQFAASRVTYNYDSNLVFAFDPANPSCFAGPPTSNEIGEGMSIYNNVSGSVTAVLTDTGTFYRGARIYKQELTPVDAAGASWLTGGNNPGIGVVTGGGGGPANTFTGHSIFFKPMFPTHTSPIYTHYSNIGGWQSSTLFEPVGDGWYRAYNTWYDTVTRSDGKYWAINPRAGVQGYTQVCYWAGPFKETQPQNSTLSTNGARAVNPYTRASRTSSPVSARSSNLFDSRYDHDGILDLSGKGNHAEMYGTLYYSDDGGGSIVLNGSNTYIRTVSSAIGGDSQEFTLEAWAKTATASGWQTVIGTEGTLRQVGFLNNNIYYGGNGGGGNAFRSAPSYTNAVVPNAWYHLVFTWDGLYPKLYVNGVVDDAPTSIGSIGALSGKPDIGRSMLGAYAAGGGEILNGKIGLSRIYNRALTAEQVAQNYNSTRGRYGR